MADANTICVIEDNLSIRKLYGILLKKAGFNVVEFEEGEPAVEWLENNHPLLVICDDILPDLTGTEILKKFRTFPHGNDTPVIAITGHAHASDRERYLEHGFDDYIAKPINTATFVEQIRRIIP
jgi:two-component system cell cycle response regulator DivK